MDRVLKVKIKTDKTGKECGVKCPWLDPDTNDCRIFGVLRQTEYASLRPQKCTQREVKE